MALFVDRHDAGRKLAEALQSLRGKGDLRVFTASRGGVPVAFEVSRALGAPLDLVEAIGPEEGSDLAGTMMVLVDDGLSTLDAMRGAIAALHAFRPHHLLVAVPAASHATCVELIGATEADEVICLGRPEPIRGEADVYRVTEAESRSPA
jgi:predicted phosphoribosyltransferase